MRSVTDSTSAKTGARAQTAETSNDRNSKALKRKAVETSKTDRDKGSVASRRKGLRDSVRGGGGGGGSGGGGGGEESGRDKVIIISDSDVESNRESGNDSGNDSDNDSDNDSEGPPFPFRPSEMLDKRKSRNEQGEFEFEFLIRWAGFGLDEDTWVLESRLTKESKALLKDYARRPLYEVRYCRDRRFGKGVFARVNISAKTKLFEFAGKRVSREESDGYQCDTRYIWELEDGVTIDSSKGGNASRYLNHFYGLAARPSVIAAEEKREEGGLDVVFYTTADVKAGEQLLLDYGDLYLNYDWEGLLAAKSKSMCVGRLRVGWCAHDRRPYMCPRCKENVRPSHSNSHEQDLMVGSEREAIKERQ